MAIDQNKGFKKKSTCADGRQKVQKKWVPPIHGHLKLNVDGAYSNNGGGVGTGMILRDHQGEAIAAACRELGNCRNATEAELCAIEDGVQLALQWYQLPLTVETDCSEAMELIKRTTPNTYVYAFRITVIRELL